MTTEALNHVNIATPLDQLSAVRDFYVEVVGLEDGPRPNIQVPGHWLYAGGAPVLHLMQQRADDGPAGVLGPVDHVAFTCSDLEGVERRLAALGVEYRRNDYEEFGFVQLFLRDPTGLGVEMNFDLGATGE